MSNQKKSDFFEIKDEAMIGKVFDVACRHNIKITVWLKNQSIKYDTKIRYFFFAMKRASIEFTPECTEQQFNQAIGAVGTEVFASFQIDQTNFFFKAPYVGTTPPDTFQIETPKSIFKLQRRANLRITFTRDKAPKVTAFDPNKTYDISKPILDADLLAFRMLDVSAGGLAIAAPPEYKTKLKTGDLLRDIRFRIRGSDIVGEGVIKFMADALSDQGKPMVRIGVEFQGLKIQYETLIAQFVMDESRKLFTLLH